MNSEPGGQKENKKMVATGYICMTSLSSNPPKQAAPFMKDVIFLSCLSGLVG